MEGLDRGKPLGSELFSSINSNSLMTQVPHHLIPNPLAKWAHTTVDRIDGLERFFKVQGHVSELTPGRETLVRGYGIGWGKGFVVRGWVFLGWIPQG